MLHFLGNIQGNVSSVRAVALNHLNRDEECKSDMKRQSFMEWLCRLQY